jgi:D-sedoheptulose 7-phosphate isomerase
MNAIQNYWQGFLEVLQGIEAFAGDQPLEYSAAVQRTVDLLRARTEPRGKILFIGNGGSAAIAGHFALDYWHAGGMRAMAFNEGESLTCVGNDHGYEQVFAMPIERFADPGDVLVAISSSGNSENIIRGVAAARAADCAVVTLSGFARDNRLKPLGDLNFHVPVRHYGYVEVAHMGILHCVLDTACGALQPTPL